MRCSGQGKYRKEIRKGGGGVKRSEGCRGHGKYKRDRKESCRGQWKYRREVQKGGMQEAREIKKGDKRVGQGKMGRRYNREGCRGQGKYRKTEGRGAEEKKKTKGHKRWGQEAREI